MNSDTDEAAKCLHAIVTSLGPAIASHAAIIGNCTVAVALFCHCGTLLARHISLTRPDLSDTARTDLAVQITTMLGNVADDVLAQYTRNTDGGES